MCKTQDLTCTFPFVKSFEVFFDIPKVFLMFLGTFRKRQLVIFLQHLVATIDS